MSCTWIFKTLPSESWSYSDISGCHYHVLIYPVLSSPTLRSYVRGRMVTIESAQRIKRPTTSLTYECRPWLRFPSSLSWPGPGPGPEWLGVTPFHTNGPWPTRTTWQHACNLKFSQQHSCLQVINCTSSALHLNMTNTSIMSLGRAARRGIHDPSHGRELVLATARADSS